MQYSGYKAFNSIEDTSSMALMRQFSGALSYSTPRFAPIEYLLWKIQNVNIIGLTRLAWENTFVPNITLGLKCEIEIY